VKIFVNPTGQFEIGGPHGDCGLTGRKIIVDTYGGRGRHGGGAFSGKDPSKVDRSAAYMARYIAKNIVAAKLARVCEVQVAYAIGVAEPVSVLVDAQGTGTVDDALLAKIVRSNFDLTPYGLIEMLKLRAPIYSSTSSHGHFGREPGEGGKGTFTWEKTDIAAALRKSAGKSVSAAKPGVKSSAKSSAKSSSKSSSKSSTKPSSTKPSSTKSSSAKSSSTTSSLKSSAEPTGSKKRSPELTLV